MRTPVIETVGPRGGRRAIRCQWQNQPDSDLAVHWAEATVRDIDKRAITVLWQGEVWPRFVTAADQRLPYTTVVTTLGARMQVAFQP